MSRNSWIALAILAVVAAVLGLVTAFNQSGVEDHIQGQWTLVEARDETGAIDSNVSAIVMTVDDTTLGGTVCNHFGGDYSLSGTSLTLGPIMTTEMWCETPAGIMDVESRFVAALANVNTVRFEGTNLVLTGVEIRLEFAQSTPG